MLTSHGSSSPLRLTGALKRQVQTPKDKQMVKQSQKLVSQTFFGTLLKQMHQSPFKSQLFSGGRGGEMFSSMLDQHLADHMASGSGSKLVGAMFHHLKKLDKGASSSLQSLKQNAYRKTPEIQGRPHVPADLRA